jgi:hypothetical protein
MFSSWKEMKHRNSLRQTTAHFIKFIPHEINIDNNQTACTQIQIVVKGSDLLQVYMEQNWRNEEMIGPHVIEKYLTAPHQIFSGKWITIVIRG